MQNDIKEKRDELKKKLETLKKEKKQKLDEKKKGVVNTALKNIFARFSERIEQLTNIDTRLGAKTTELQTKGTDVTNTIALLTSAKTALEKAKVDIEATKTLASEQTSTSTSKEVLKSLINTADASIKSAKDSYKKVGESLRPFLEGSTSTSTPVNASTSLSTATSTN
jgi:chromosome segregation ATPase